MKKLNKKGKLATALLISGSLLFTGYIANYEKAPTPAKTVEKSLLPVYEDEYTFEIFKVDLINHKGEVFASSIKVENGNGLYLDNNRINLQPGDIARGVFDSENGDLIAVEKDNDYIITFEDGSTVNAHEWTGGEK